jgi:Ca2+-binding RTX toxin-like protein
VASSHAFETAEDTAITITNAQLLEGATDIDAGAILTISNVSLADGANGTLMDNHDGTYTFIPSLNYSGSGVELNYTLTDQQGATDTQNVTITVTPVADAPILNVSVIEGDATIGPVYPAPDFNTHLNAGSTTGNIVFDGYTKTAEIDIRSYKTSVDDGRIVFLRDGVVVKEFLIDDLLPHANNQPTHLVLTADDYFNTIRIDNFSTSTNTNAEFKVNSVSLISDLAVDYTLNIGAAVSDSSETLGQVLIDQSTLPLGASLYANGEPVYDTNGDGYYSVDPGDTITMTTDHYMSVDEINAITSSVTSWDDGDFATTTVTAYNDISGTDGDDLIPGSIGDDMMHGNDGSDTLHGDFGNDVLYGDAGDDALYGDDGNDFLDGGIGSDALYGGAGNDTLVYDSSDTQADGGSGIDTLLAKSSVMDFSTISDSDINNIEVLDLSKASVTVTNLNPGDVFEMTDNVDTVLKIVGNSDDSIASTFSAGGESAWTVVTDQSGVDDGFTRYEGLLDDGVTKVFVDVQDTIVHTDFD